MRDGRMSEEGRRADDEINSEAISRAAQKRRIRINIENKSGKWTGKV